MSSSVGGDRTTTCEKILKAMFPKKYITRSAILECHYALFWANYNNYVPYFRKFNYQET